MAAAQQLATEVGALPGHFESIGLDKPARRSVERATALYFEPITKHDAPPALRKTSLPANESTNKPSRPELTSPVKAISMKRPPSTPNTPRVAKITQRSRLALQDKSNAGTSPDKPTHNKAQQEFLDGLTELTRQKMEVEEALYDTDDLLLSESDALRMELAQMNLERQFDAQLYEQEISEWQQVASFLELEKKFGI